MAKMTPEDWLIEIDNAKEYRREYGFEDSWANLDRMWNNDPNSSTSVGSNLIYSMGDTLLAGLAVPDPEFVAYPENPRSAEAIPIIESLDNYLLRKLKMKRHVEHSLLYGYLRSKCILKIGYDSEFGWSPQYDIGTAQSYGLSVSQFDKAGRRIEFNDITPGMPWVAAVDPIDFVVPWGTIYLEDAPWCAHRVVRLNRDIKADLKYRNTSRLEPQLSMEDYMDSYNASSKYRRTYSHNQSMYNVNTRMLYNELWEIHDRRTGEIIVVSPDYDKFLRKELDAMPGIPFVAEGFTMNPKSFWSTPQAYYLGQIQEEENDIAIQGTKQRRLSVLRFLVRENAMTIEEANKLVSGNVGAAARIKGNGPLKEAITTAPQNNNNFELEAMSNANRSNARDAVGFSRNQLGEFDSSSRRTAQEVRSVAGGAGRREQRRVQSMSSLYIDTMRKINQIVFKFWRLPRYTLVEDKWIQFTGEQIAGDYMYDMSLSNKRYLSSAEKKLEALQMVMQFGNMPGVNLEMLYKNAIDAANDPTFERIFTDPNTKNKQLTGGQPGGA